MDLNVANHGSSVEGFDRPAASLTSSGTPRLIGLDVARAIALVGVVAMNYAGSLVTPGSDRGFWGRVFDPYTGVLSTRFAAAFVVVAGIGITLLTERARVSGNRAEVRRARRRLARRGLLLYAVGFFLDFTWPGTILFYYGAYFLIATMLFRFTTRSLTVIALASGFAATTVSTWSTWRWSRGEPVDWLDVDRVNSLQDLAVRTFLDYTHPVLPWITFVCTGMIIGRHLPTIAAWRRRVLVISVTTTVSLYLVATILDRTSSRNGVIVHHLTSMQTFDRGLVFLLSTLGIAVIAVLVVDSIARRASTNPLVVVFQRAGQLTLSLYLLHVLAFTVVVDWFEWVSGGSLSTALMFAGSFWVIGLSVASWWHHRVGRGPAEIVYRLFGG